MKEIILASHNPGKLKEFEQLFLNSKFKIIPQTKFNVEEIEETGLTFIENAILKARNACANTGLPSIADDSGLEVDALQGAPGIYSSRFAGINATQREHTNKLLSELKNIEIDKRTARFHCLLVYMRHEKDPTPIISHGIWKGKILFEPKGQADLHYDPVFLVEDMNCSAAELSPEQKNKLSHRGQATRKLFDEISHL